MPELKGAGEDAAGSTARQLPARTARNATVSIQGESGNELSIEVMGREHPGFTDYWDGNWLTSRVTVRAGAFRGAFGASLRAEEFARLRDGVRVCMTEPRGTFVFETMEEQLSIVARGDGQGHFRAECRAQDAAGIGNELVFEVVVEMAGVDRLASQLDVLLRLYPILGTPRAK